MNLKPRFLLLTTALILVSSAAAWLAFERATEGIIEQWGLRLAQTQVRYDSAQLLRPLAREIALVRQMAGSQVLRRWAQEPDAPDATAQAVAEMESFRINFRDANYFVALVPSGAYYFNNRDNEFDGRQLHHHHSPDEPEYRWLYEVAKGDREFRLGVEREAHLGLTKLWIAAPIHTTGEPLGAVGTGLDLDAIFDEVVATAQPGIAILFADHDGVIQLHYDPDRVDGLAVRHAGEPRDLERLFEDPADRAAMREAMGAVEAAPGTVSSRFVRVGGERRLAGVAYLPELGWFEVTLLDLGVLVPLRDFAGLVAILAIALLSSLAIFNLILNRMVLRPLAALEAAMRRVREGDYSAPPLPRTAGEIGRLMAHFESMAEAIGSQTRTLEDQVRDRTEALHLLARIDPLTELYNRRGMTELIEQEITRARRHGKSFGLLWLDIDWFKQVNDRFGHAEGDRVLAAVARLLRANIRPYDSPGRWGGDEFLVLVPESGADSVAGTGERIRAAIAEGLRLPSGDPVTVSVGAYLAAPGETLELILQRADQALYAAKEAGRNCVRCYGEPAATNEAI